METINKLPYQLATNRLADKTAPPLVNNYRLTDPNLDFDHNPIYERWNKEQPFSLRKHA